MLGAARAYQANLTAIGLIRDTFSGRWSSGEVSHGDRRTHRTAFRPASPRSRAGDAAAPPAGAGFGDALGTRRAGRSSRPPARPTPPSAGMLDGTGDVHDAMIALQHADMMLQLTVQIRNKLVQAYQDIMRMPV